METIAIEDFENIRDNAGEIIPITGKLIFAPDAPNDEKFEMDFTITPDDLAYFDEKKYNNTVFRV